MLEQVRTLVGIMKRDAVSQRGVSIETQCSVIVSTINSRLKKEFVPYLSLQRIDFHNDWKVITMFVGGNDICDFCTNSVSTFFDLLNEMRFIYFLIFQKIFKLYHRLKYKYSSLTQLLYLFITIIILFLQIFFSPRNVVGRIQQALDLLHSEVII